MSASTDQAGVAGLGSERSKSAQSQIPSNTPSVILTLLYKNVSTPIRHRSSLEADRFPALPLQLENYVDPGAGLRQIQDAPGDSDFIFDTLFMTDVSGLNFADVDFSTGMPLVPPPSPMARTYRTSQDM